MWVRILPLAKTSGFTLVTDLDTDTEKIAVLCFYISLFTDLTG